MSSRHAKGLFVCVMVVAAVLSVVAAGVAAVRIEVHSPTAGLIVISARGMAELFAALIAAQRFNRIGRRLDFGIAIGLGTMAASDLVFSLSRATLGGTEVSPAAVIPYQLVGAALLAATAFSSDRALSPRSRRQAVVAGVGVVTVGLLLLQEVHVIPGSHAEAVAQPPIVVALRLGAATLLTAAAVGFAYRRRPSDDPFVGWLAAAAVLAALAQLHRVLVPATAGPTTFSWAHILQLAAAAALLGGVVEETRGYQRRLAELAVADERRRIARDMHDGLAQDIAFISSQSRDLADESGDERLQLIADAARRALEDSRFIIRALTRTTGQPLGASIALQAQEFARRWGVAVDVAVADNVNVAPEKQQAILRIVGEALSNAARHADASHVEIRLEDRDGRLRIAVWDDGRGFDTHLAQESGAGFGLRSMRERADLVGAELHLESRPGAGTRVELALP